MKQILSMIGYSDKLTDKNRYAYIIAGIALVQILMFLVLYAFLDDAILLIVQTIIVFVLYVSALILLKRKIYCFGKILITLLLGVQVFLLTWIWFPRDTYFLMYFFIIPPISFFIFDLEIKSERRSLIWINVILSALIIFTGISDPLEKLTLHNSFIEVIRFMTMILTYLVEVLVFFTYAVSLSKTEKELRILANTDVLTNIANRRVLFERGDQIHSICRKYEKSFTLMILDIDHFKLVNDKYGHPIGDKVLIELTELISSSIRLEDLLCRYGGEEFAILLRNVDNDQKFIIENIREKIGNHRFYVGKDDYIHITFSAGVITCHQNYTSFDDLVVSADKLLYQAKSLGRNQIIFENGEIIS